MSLARKTFRPALVLAFGTGLLWLATAGGAAEETAKNSSAQVRQLLQERLEIAEEILEWRQTQYENGIADYDDILAAQNDLLRIKLELAQSSQERIEIYKRMIELAKQSVEHARLLVMTGRGSKVEALQGESQVLKFRIALAREQTAQNPNP